MPRTCNHPCCEEVCRRPKGETKARVPLKRTPVKKTAVKIKKVGKKQGQRLNAYRKLRIKILLKRPVCEMMVVPECQYYGTDIHHPEGRIGDRLLDEDELIVGCRICHDWAETHPKEAKELGLSKSRLAKD